MFCGLDEGIKIKFVIDTIVAPATALYPSAIGIVRISGERTSEIISKLTKRNNFRPRFAHLVQIYDEDGSLMDEGILIFYQKPKSYTGEDMAEIFVHGNPILINHIIKLCIKYGARIAQEGEFTKRAFLNGKISLEKAEAVLSIVNSPTILGVKASLKILKGEFGKIMESIRQKIVDVLSDLQASVDFPEDVDIELPREKIEENLRGVLSYIQGIYESWRRSRFMSEDIVCVIIGKPNAGKSSLFNSLVGESRAIISPFPGTTRDYIDARIDVGGVIAKIIDTAGIRHTPDPVEQEGIKRAIELSKKGNIIICVFDSSSDFTQDDRKTIEVALSSEEAELIIFAINKSDIGNVDYYKKVVSEFTSSSSKKIEIIPTSCVRNENIENVRNTIKDFVMSSGNSEFFALSSRQVAIIQSVMEDTSRALEYILSSDYLGAILHLQDALTKIDDIFGKGSLPEVIENIFSKFCIGK